MNLDKRLPHDQSLRASEVLTAAGFPVAPLPTLRGLIFRAAGTSTRKQRTVFEILEALFEDAGC